jgi:hypothetical protein
MSFFNAKGANTRKADSNGGFRFRKMLFRHKPSLPLVLALSSGVCYDAHFNELDFPHLVLAKGLM